MKLECESEKKKKNGFIFQKGLYCVVTITLSSLGFVPVLIWGLPLKDGDTLEICGGRQS